MIPRLRPRNFLELQRAAFPTQDLQKQTASSLWYILIQDRRKQVTLASQEVPALNPLVQEQKFYNPPVFPESEFIFSPSTADIEKAERLFVPSKKHVIQYFKGVYHPSDVTAHKKAEIAFLGRSNVGKSSLIKVLLRAEKNLQVRTSKTPGHTKLLNFFEVGGAFMLVDMPGYGFRQPENFEHSAEGYLKSSKKLMMTFFLVDSAVGLQPTDFVAIDMLNQFGVPFTFTLTKADKANKRALHSTLVGLRRAIDEKAATCLPQPLLVSAVKSTGIPYLKGFIAYITGNLAR